MVFITIHLLRIFSAGNAGGETYSNGLGAGLDKLTADKNCKNGLIVANANVSVNLLLSDHLFQVLI